MRSVAISGNEEGCLVLLNVTRVTREGKASDEKEGLAPGHGRRLSNQNSR